MNAPGFPADGPVHLDTALGYARFYSAEVSLDAPGALVVGLPGLVMASAAGMAVGRARAEDRARAWAAPQWREHRLVRVVVTATATWCCVEGQWICFPHDAVLEYYVDGSTVVMAFAECARLALTGRAAWTHTVIFAYARYSDTSWQDAPWRHPLTKLQPATSGRVQQLS